MKLEKIFENIETKINLEKERKNSDIYILYKSYTDETRNMLDERFNTRIIGIYNDKKIAKGELMNYINSIVDNLSSKYNWYVKKFNKKVIRDDNKDIIEIYEVYNDYIDNIAEVFYVILEKKDNFLGENE